MNERNILSQLNIDLNHKLNNKQKELIKVKEELDILKTAFIEVENMHNDCSLSFKYNNSDFSD